jgi:hypothetical protein
MIAIGATWKNGQIVPDEKVDWPDGCRLTIEVEPFAAITGMTEDEQGDAPEAVAEWIAEFRAIPALIMSSEEEAGMLAWEQRMKEFNIEAVRRQMQEGIS